MAAWFMFSCWYHSVYEWDTFEALRKEKKLTCDQARKVQGFTLNLKFFYNANQ